MDKCRINKLLVFGITIALYLTEVESGINLKERIFNQEDEGAISCIVHITQKHLLKDKSNAGSLIILNFAPNISTFSHLLTKMITKESNYAATFLTKYEQFPTVNKHLFSRTCTGYILSLNEMWELEPTILLWKSRYSWNPSAKVFVLLYKSYDSDVLESIEKKVMETFLQYNMLNIRIISYQSSTDNVLNVKTWYPFKNENCASKVMNLEPIGKCKYKKNSFEYTEYATSDIVVPRFLPGCKLRFSTSIQEPYVYYSHSTGNFSGMEILLAKSIAQKMQMIPEFVPIKETRSNRVVSNETGIYSLLFQRQTDLLIGGLDNDGKLPLGQTMGYLQDDQSWCMHKALPSDTWQNIFSLFTLEMWFLMIGFTIIITVLMYFLLINNKHYKLNNHFSYAWLVSFASFLNMSPTFHAHTHSLKIVFFFALVYGIIFSATFSSSLISVLTRPRQGFQPKNIKEAYKHGVRFTAGNIASSHIRDSGDDDAALILERFTYCPNIEACLLETRTDTKLAVGLSRQHAFNSPHIHRTDIFCFPHDSNIYTYSVLMRARIDFYLLPHINHIIWNLVEHGFVYNWLEQNQNYTSIRKNAKSTGPNQLTVNHILGAIVVLTVGLILASLVFIFETFIMPKIQYRRNRILFLTNTLSPTNFKDTAII